MCPSRSLSTRSGIIFSTNFAFELEINFSPSTLNNFSHSVLPKHEKWRFIQSPWSRRQKLEACLYKPSKLVYGPVDVPEPYVLPPVYIVAGELRELSDVLRSILQNIMYFIVITRSEERYKQGRMSRCGTCGWTI